VRIALFFGALVACSRGSTTPDASTVNDASSDASIDAATDASAADAAPPSEIGPLETLRVEDIPAGLVVPRPIVKALGWTDGNGENRVVFSSRTRHLREDADPVDIVDLTITHAVSKNGTWVVLLTKKEHVDCGGGGAKLLLSPAMSLQDTNQNGLAELHFSYKIPCMGDPTRAVAAVVVIENGK